VRLSAGVRELGVAGRVVALLGSALVLTASGTIAGEAAQQPRAAAAPAAAPKPKPAARISITPRDGAQGVRPDLGIQVKAGGGTLRSVVVRAKGGATVDGELSRDHKSWRALWTLAPDTSYAVRATAVSRHGKLTTRTSSFRTLAPQQTISVADVTPNDGETVGVGMPITVTFSRPVLNKDQVEKALEVRSTKPARGAWRWVSDQQAIFRTSRYWEPHERITVTAHLAGVRAAKDVYGTSDATRTFSVGTANVSVVNVQTHRMVVSRDGKRVRDIGISAGKGGSPMFTTTNGVHAVMGKGSPVVMTSEWMGVTDPKDPRYYKLTVFDAVQISSSGEYVHSAPWSVWAQGNSNVSHGCVNASPEFAEWFYGISQRGDIVTVTGTNRELEWNNGYGYWQMPWKQWVQGSALKQPVQVTHPAVVPVSRQPLR
jgi:lipoprotein-anchoring transpeptidase ErfK/SrfK